MQKPTIPVFVKQEPLDPNHPLDVDQKLMDDLRVIQVLATEQPSGGPKSSFLQGLHKQLTWYGIWTRNHDYGSHVAAMRAVYWGAGYLVGAKSHANNPEMLALIDLLSAWVEKAGDHLSRWMFDDRSRVPHLNYCREAKINTFSALQKTDRQVADPSWDGFTCPRCRGHLFNTMSLPATKDLPEGQSVGYCNSYLPNAIPDLTTRCGFIWDRKDQAMEEICMYSKPRKEWAGSFPSGFPTQMTGLTTSQILTLGDDPLVYP
jgi:hypothetical protein